MKTHPLTIIMFACLLALSAAQGESFDFKSPAEAQKWIGKIMQMSRPEPSATNDLYATGLSMFDMLIPYNPFLKKAPDEKWKGHYKFTFHDGMLVKCQAIGADGVAGGAHRVWYNEAKAPILSAYHNREGFYESYSYAEYGDTGKVKAIYRFSETFSLRHFNRFWYPGKTTHVQHFDSDSKLGDSTLYDENGIFTVTKGKKQQVNGLVREDALRTWVKFGMKPLYPGY